MRKISIDNIIWGITMNVKNKTNHSETREIKAPEVIDINLEGGFVVIKLNDDTEWISDFSLENAKAWKELAMKDHYNSIFRRK